MPNSFFYLLFYVPFGNFLSYIVSSYFIYTEYFQFRKKQDTSMYEVRHLSYDRSRKACTYFTRSLANLGIACAQPRTYTFIRCQNLDDNIHNTRCSPPKDLFQFQTDSIKRSPALIRSVFVPSTICTRN